MLPIESDAQLVNDREDLIAVLRMRFGDIPGEMIEQIYEISDMNTLQRLILAAANASSWNVFLDEMQAGEDSFRLVGEDFNPMKELLNGKEGTNGEKEK
ncbi:hypothetical protein [Bacillus seohaeanensis]|jgi:hypothetical protein|uniref:Phage protein n=1 Tax=Bacillus seohaeanensis TaxID=284580 RepID=A0ABW5RW55_9BACI